MDRQRFNWKGLGGALAALLLGVTFPLGAQSATARTLTGQVVNTVTGAPIPRALVTVNTRSVLTDPQGRFQFPQFTDARASARVTRPGFTASLDPSVQFNLQPIADLDAPIVLKLYPDGIIRGTITDQEGLPLARVPVSLMRASYDQRGLHETTLGFGMTDSHGQYRFREPPGRYRVVLRYVPRLAENGEAAQPVHVPDGSPRQDAGYFPLASAEERVVDLHTVVSPTYTVTLRMDLEDGRRGVQLTAINAAGEVFQLPAMPAGDQGQYRVSLPSGSYQLHASVNETDQMLEGSGRVTVAGHDVPEVPLHLMPVASLPIEVTIERAANDAAQGGSASAQTLTAQSLGLYLHPLADQVEGVMNELQPIPLGDGRFQFRAPAGRYRLQQNQSFVHITSATCGGVNAMTDEIAVGPGTAGSVIRITATDGLTQVSGTIAPAPDAVASASGVSPGWVYLLPQFPSLNPVMPIRIAARGSWSARIYPGTYTVLAVPETIQADLTDAAVATRYARLGKTVLVGDAGTGSIEVNLVTAVEGTP